MNNVLKIEYNAFGLFLLQSCTFHDLTSCCWQTYLFLTHKSFLAKNFTIHSPVSCSLINAKVSNWHNLVSTAHPNYWFSFMYSSEYFTIWPWKAPHLPLLCSINSFFFLQYLLQLSLMLYFLPATQFPIYSACW
jgi:hypothetical protein